MELAGRLRTADIVFISDFRDPVVDRVLVIFPEYFSRITEEAGPGIDLEVNPVRTGCHMRLRIRTVSRLDGDKQQRLAAKSRLTGIEDTIGKKPVFPRKVGRSQNRVFCMTLQQ